ncbi:hypothetical protein TrLO_g9255 [Triparma laevis f. longispina]|uniref:Uncharacterized protein n=1 Tax=Triparma laevis f. longispina TaxID=1714387 RepID=A0A9W7FPE4_9STRA|nr:hypothetical protein TrLO_g9255 [Triparma laevis f. longispina]
MRLARLLLFAGMHSPIQITTTHITLLYRLQTTRLFAAPRKKLPERRVTISCASCGTKLYRYAKGNGANSRLVKVYKERIVNDFTDADAPCNCPNPECTVEFAREDVIHGRPAFKIIQGKAVMK